MNQWTNRTKCMNQWTNRTKCMHQWTNRTKCMNLWSEIIKNRWTNELREPGKCEQIFKKNEVVFWFILIKVLIKIYNIELHILYL